MSDKMTRPTHGLQTTLDRAGLALALGGVLGGIVVTLLVVAGGELAPGALLVALILGTLGAALAIAATAGPFWLALHVSGHRRAWHAAALGAAVAMVLFLIGQVHGYGSGDAGGIAFYRWTSALATSLLIATAAAGVGLAMWRVAYRPA